MEEGRGREGERERGREGERERGEGRVRVGSGETYQSNMYPDKV